MSSQVSVVIPTYNCAQLLPRAIASAFDQSLAPHEVVVVNDGSTDDTAEVLENLRPRYPSLVVDHTANGGEAAARNRGVALASGRYVAFLDQDDTWHPLKLQRQLDVMRTEPDVAFVFTAYARVEGDQRTQIRVQAWDSNPEAALHRLMIGSLMPPSTVIVERTALVGVGGFDESYAAGCDWKMWLALSAAGHRMAYIDEPLMEYSVHETNMSRDELRTAVSALRMFEELFEWPQLPDSVKRKRRWCLARWHMITAFRQSAAGDRRAAARHLRRASTLRPASIRAGWVRALR